MTSKVLGRKVQGGSQRQRTPRSSHLIYKRGKTNFSKSIYSVLIEDDITNVHYVQTVARSTSSNARYSVNIS